MGHVPELTRGLLGGIPEGQERGAILEVLSVLGPLVGLHPPRWHGGLCDRALGLFGGFYNGAARRAVFDRYHCVGRDAFHRVWDLPLAKAALAKRDAQACCDLFCDYFDDGYPRPAITHTGSVAVGDDRRSDVRGL